MTENTISQPNSETQFLSHLKNIIDISQDHQSNVVVVGGLALRASMNKPVEFCRPNGTTPDIDMIGLGPNPDSLVRLNPGINHYCHHHSDCPSVGFEPVRFSPKPKLCYSPFEVLSGLRRDDYGEYYLTFRGIDQPIPYQTMDVIPRLYGSVQIPTLPQETTLHRYETRMGYLKPKDISKICEFSQYIAQNGGDGFKPEFYQSYLDFCQKINQEYPVVVRLTRAYWNFDANHDGKISGANGFIYKLTQLFHR